MNIFDKNRNDLSKYFYDLSKGVLLSFLAVPVFQKNLNFYIGLAGFLMVVLFLALGFFLKKG